jgi:ArsR family transcriptional regulator, arsenate/arsenite/antimonite-responsive transcriptional repressor
MADVECGPVVTAGERDDCTHPPLSLSSALDREAAEQLAKLLKAVAEPTRLQLISMIRSSAAGEACVCDLSEPLGLRQPTVSYHLKILSDAGLVTVERRGTWMWYSLVPGALDSLGSLLR